MASTRAAAALEALALRNEPPTGIDVRSTEPDAMPLRIRDVPLPAAARNAPPQEWVTFGVPLDPAGERLLRTLYFLTYSDAAARDAYFQVLTSVVQLARNYALESDDVILAVAAYIYLETLAAVRANQRQIAMPGGPPQPAQAQGTFSAAARLHLPQDPMDHEGNAAGAPQMAIARYGPLLTHLTTIVERLTAIARRKFQGYMLAFNATGPLDPSAVYIPLLNQ